MLFLYLLDLYIAFHVYNLLVADKIADRQSEKGYSPQQSRMISHMLMFTLNHPWRIRLVAPLREGLAFLPAGVAVVRGVTYWYTPEILAVCFVLLFVVLHRWVPTFRKATYYLPLGLLYATTVVLITSWYGTWWSLAGGYAVITVHHIAINWVGRYRLTRQLGGVLSAHTRP